MIEALIFDFGGVISKTLFETHALTEQALGLAPGSLHWHGPFGDDPLWQDMQADKISERDYWLQRSREVGLQLGETWTDMQTLVQRARGDDPEKVLRPEVLSLLQEAKDEGLRLCLLSNELDLFYGASMRQRLGVLTLFEFIVDATYTGILKPDPRAYQACLDELGLIPSQCMMVDDQLRNVAGASALGMASLQFDVKNPAHSCALIRQSWHSKSTDSG
jgi:putative hydrolase of the HAD superfamily